MTSELQDQLQGALSGSYTLDRELGGGGMSRVFLAHEVALGRRVVVKVLPPEMAAGVNIERFRREIQLAASLQHPHIVPLHAAGQAGDLFYYTMPLVEGESLRAKLAREGELPVADALRILKDVVDALAYAHAHGVVHRDIKPDNILISGHHAVVTDFGVAKAVSAASGGASSLTSLGVALGTPAYMAPEQAVADPHVDQRADIYSVGVLAYEMLCGRPPFTGMAPQQVLAAHVMQTPDPVTAHRSAVSPALNALVMRCLEKKPADRVQTADELLTQLDAMTTPSGGMAPSGTVSAVSSGTETALRRTHPVRVLALFTAASLVMLALVYLLMIKLGLPTWVFAAAVTLLVIGLPIIILTGIKERERARAHATGTSLSPPRGMARLFTWRRALGGGGAAFAALAIVAIAYTAMRLLGIGPVGTLVASGVLKERQPIILADFDNRAADSTLGVTLTEAFRVDLSQSPTVQLVTSQAIAAALLRMQHAVPAPLTPELAREIAQRDGVKAVVDGQIDPVGKSYLLSARVVSVADGATLAAVRETAANEAELIPALDRLSRALRERIGESLVTIRANDPLEKVTTGSLEALRQYTQAVRLADAGSFEAAEQLLKAATTIDTGFAMAWRKRAAMENNMGANTSQIVASATHAFANRSRLPELERDLTEAYYYVTGDFDPARAIAANRAALELDPGSEIALNNLSIIYQGQGQYAAADSLLTHAVSLGQGGTIFVNLITNQIYQGRIAAAESTVQRYEHAGRGDPGAPLFAGYLSTAQMDYPAAEQSWNSLKDVASTKPGLREQLNGDLAALSLTQGRLAAASTYAAVALSAAVERQQPGDYLLFSSQMARIDLRYRNQPAAALARITSALSRFPLASMDPLDRPYSQLAMLYAEAGKPDEARRLLSENDRVVPAGRRKADFDRFGAEGAVALAEGRTQDAIASFRSWHDESGCVWCGFFGMGQAFQKANQPDSAIAYYERAVNAKAWNRVFGDAFDLAATYQRLGELYEARGDRAKALDYYGRFVDLWKTADPELQPIVRDVRARMARLSAEH